MATSGGLVTRQELIDAQEDVTHLGEVANSTNPTDTSRKGVVHKTLSGLQSDYQDAIAQFEANADVAIANAGYQDAGDYENDDPINSPNDYLVYQRATAPTQWKTVSGVSLPYTPDSTTTPDPEDDPNLELIKERPIVTSIAELKARSVSTDASIYLSDAGRSGWFEWRTGDFSTEVSVDTVNGVYVPSDSDPTGVIGCWVRASDYVTPEMFSISDISGTAAAWVALFSAIRPILGTPGATYIVSEGVVLSDIEVDFDLKGSEVINTSATDRAFIFEYPYSNVQSVSSVDLVNSTVDVSTISGMQEGDRAKIVSADRAIGNRPAPGDGSNYWQAQTLTISGFSGTTVSFRQPFEEDYTFATTPKIMLFNKKACRIYNGRMYCEKGFADTRDNGLIRIKGGSHHKIDIDVENSNQTAIEFWGCDYPVCTGNSISNVGRNTDTSGSHGYSHISCNGPQTLNCTFSRTRHGQTNNDTPTQYSDDNYYVMGVTYDERTSGCVDYEDIAGAFSTHHGVRRSQKVNNIAVGCAIGAGIRGRDVTVDGLKCINCGEGVVVYSEASVDSVDKTTRWYVKGVETINITGDNDLQVQECQFGTLGSNNWKGGAPRGWFFNNGGTVAIHGHQEFFSDGTFGPDGNYLQTVNTNVEVFATMSIDIDSMTINGANNVIRATSDRFFKAYGRITVEEPVGMSNIYLHIGTGDTVLEDVRYSEDIGFPFTASSTNIRWKGQTQDGSYSTKYQIQTVTATWSASINSSIEDEITVVGLLSGNHTLTSMPEGKFEGQKMLLRVVDTTGTTTYTLTVDNNATRIDLAGPDIDLVHRNCLRFVWTGSVWAVESRTI